MAHGRSKYRRNIFLKLRALGYTSKEELKPFKKAIQEAAWNRTKFKYPESLIIKHHKAMGAIKAKQKALEAKEKVKEIAKKGPSYLRRNWSRVY